MLTEEDFRTERKVLINGYKAMCYVGYYNTNIIRLKLDFESEYPTWGQTFQTRNFIFKNNNKLGWGLNGQEFSIILDN